MSICLVRSWNTGFAAICKVTLESQYNKAGYGKDTCKSLSKDLIHMISQQATAMARYSTLAEDWEMVRYFLDFQETKESPRNKQKPVTDFLVSGQATQSASQKALSLKSDEARKNNPKLGADLI